MIDFNNLFKDLEGERYVSPVGRDYFLGCSIPDYNNYRLAKDLDNFPCLLISSNETSVSKYYVSIKLEHFFVLYDVKCKIISNNNIETNNFNIICCADKDPQVQEYFLRICSALLPILGYNPTKLEISKVIDKLLNLFRTLNESPKKTIQGLWAELFLISQSRKPGLLIESWHQSPQDKYDFCNGNERIEVKSTASERRCHHFSYSQLNPEIKLNLIVASVFVKRLASGLSVIELMDKIKNQISQNAELTFIVDQVIGLTLGNNLRSAYLEKFDQNEAINTLKLYDVNLIPNLSVIVPKEISDIHFKVDLTNIPPINEYYPKQFVSIIKAIL